MLLFICITTVNLLLPSTACVCTCLCVCVWLDNRYHRRLMVSIFMYVCVHTSKSYKQIISIASVVNLSQFNDIEKMHMWSLYSNKFLALPWTLNPRLCPFDFCNLLVALSASDSSVCSPLVNLLEVSYMFKLQSPSKYSPCSARQLLRLFSTAQNSFWIHQFWCLLMFLPFLFHLFHVGKTVSLRTFFIWGNNIKVSQGKIKHIGRVGHAGHASFGQKLLNSQRGVGRCTYKSPIMK